jgi:hypothetical protein
MLLFQEKENLVAKQAKHDIFTTINEWFFKITTLFVLGQIFCTGDALMGFVINDLSVLFIFPLVDQMLCGRLNAKLHFCNLVIQEINTIFYKSWFHKSHEARGAQIYILSTWGSPWAFSITETIGSVPRYST